HKPNVRSRAWLRRGRTGLEGAAAGSGCSARLWIVYVTRFLEESHLHIRTLLQVDAFDEADFAGAQGHDHRRRSRAFAEEADAFHQGAVGDAGCGENELLAGG